MKRLIIIYLFVGYLCLILNPYNELLAQSKKKKHTTDIPQLTYEEQDFVHRLDYDFRHPDSEIKIWQLQNIFYPNSSYSSPYIEMMKQRLTDGLRDTSNLIDLIRYHQESYKQFNYQSWVIASFLHEFLPSLEPEELNYLLTLQNTTLHSLAKKYAVYLKENSFPPRN